MARRDNKYNRERNKANTTAKALGLANTPQQYSGMGRPPAPNSPDLARFINEVTTRDRMANDPQNANRLAQNKQLILKGLAEDANPKSKNKKALEKVLSKFKGGKGGRLPGIGIGGGAMPYDVR